MTNDQVDGIDAGARTPDPAGERKQIEGALRESEHRFRTLSDLAPVGIFETDGQGRCHYVNQAWMRFSGLSSEEAAGDGWMRAVHPEDRERVTREWRQAVVAGDAFTSEYRFQRPDGVVTWLQGSAAELRDGSTPTGFIGTLADITERKVAEQALREGEALLQLAQRSANDALRHSERIYRGIGESILYGTWICDVEGRNVYASPTFLELLGLTQEQCSEYGWGDALHPEEAAATIAAWKECVRTGTSWEREHTFRGRDGRTYHILARGVPIRDEQGRIVCWAGINLDITARVAAERALMDADERKDQFLATLAHELRNPLAPIVNGLQLLHRTNQSDPAAVRALAMMDRQVGHMVRLVDDLLEVSRITHGLIELRRERIDLAAVLSSALEAARPLIDAGRHSLEIDLPSQPLLLEADPVRVAQILSNLIGNSAKYMSDGGRIRIHAYRAGDGEIAISVQDTGMGISSDVLPRVFELFAQVDRTPKRGQSGLGIGLGLARKLVEMHGGRIEARSEGLGRGSEFVVHLPALPELGSANEEAASRPRNTPGAGKRILVVDDNVDGAESLGLLLEMLGHEVQLAHDGNVALEKAIRQRPDIIILDLSLPGIDGYEVARRLRSDPDSAPLLLVAATGHGLAEHRRRTREAGFDAHLLKPIDLADLEPLLADHRDG